MVTRALDEARKRFADKPGRRSKAAGLGAVLPRNPFVVSQVEHQVSSSDGAAWADRASGQLWRSD
jgi:hypothetical protein